MEAMIYPLMPCARSTYSRCTSSIICFSEFVEEKKPRRGIEEEAWTLRIGSLLILFGAMRCLELRNRRLYRRLTRPDDIRTVSSSGMTWSRNNGRQKELGPPYASIVPLIHFFDFIFHFSEACKHPDNRVWLRWRRGGQGGTCTDHLGHRVMLEQFVEPDFPSADIYLVLF